jgi:predicted transposase YbfD/YdcC
LITRETIIKKSAATRAEQIPYISSLLNPTPEQFLALARAQWVVENSFFNVRDVTFREDQHTLRAGNGPLNMTMARNFAISLANLMKAKSIPDSFALFRCEAPALLRDLRLSG